MFLERFAPVACWKDIVAHPLEDWAELTRSYNVDNASYDHLTSPNWWEVGPEELSSQQISAIIESSYQHRSSFIHEGLQPPHKDPGQYERYFQEVTQFTETQIVRVLLPTYSLLCGLARHSISQWIASLPLPEARAERG